MVDSHIGEIPSAWLEFNVPIYQIAEASPLLGFHFHRGTMACGRRRPLHEATAFVENWEERKATCAAAYLHSIQDPENMGLILRCCAALNVNDVIIGPSCVDPYARRVIRVSMSTVLKLNLLKDKEPSEFIQKLNKHNIISIASTLSKDSCSLRDFRPDRPSVLFLGNEANGLPEDLVRQCQTRLSIPMRTGIDSLNVSHAAAIFLYALTDSE